MTTGIELDSATNPFNCPDSERWIQSLFVSFENQFIPKLKNTKTKSTNFI
jgi:hypothetical protein